MSVLDAGDVGLRDIAAVGELLLCPTQLGAPFAYGVARVEELGEAFDGTHVAKSMCSGTCRRAGNERGQSEDCVTAVIGDYANAVRPRAFSLFGDSQAKAVVHAGGPVLWKPILADGVADLHVRTGSCGLVVV